MTRTQPTAEPSWWTTTQSFDVEDNVEPPAEAVNRILDSDSSNIVTNHGSEQVAAGLAPEDRDEED